MWARVRARVSVLSILQLSSANTGLLYICDCVRVCVSERAPAPARLPARARLCVCVCVCAVRIGGGLCLRGASVCMGWLRVVP